VDRLHALDIPETLAEVCDPRRTALIVYDMQAGILRQLADADRLLAAVLEVLDAARAAGVRTVFTRHVSMPTELAGIFQLRQAKVWERKDRAADTHPLFPRDAPQTQLAPELAPRDSEGVVDKITMSAFEGTFLDIVLRDCGVVSVILVGVAIEVGIEPTARHAADLGYIPVIVKDALGWGDEAAAKRSLEALEWAGDSVIADVAGVRAALGA
jgi:nicotinamidase-related amidase